MKSAETCCCSLCTKLYTYLYKHIVVLDKYIHSNLVYYKNNGDDEPYDFTPFEISSLYWNQEVITSWIHNELWRITDFLIQSAQKTDIFKYSYLCDSTGVPALT